MQGEGQNEAACFVTYFQWFAGGFHFAVRGTRWPDSTASVVFNHSRRILGAQRHVSAYWIGFIGLRRATLAQSLRQECGGAQMDERRRNWSLWAGFLFCLAALVSYFLIFDKFAATRDVPWVTFLIFGIGAAFLLVGLKRAFGTPERYKGKIAGPVLSVLSLALVGLFCFFVFYLTRQLPASSGAPRVGQKAPEFVLTDTSDQPVSLASLLSAPMANSGKPPRGVVLIFYRGYW